MAAPKFVPVPAGVKPRTYSSPPRRPGSWEADRPGDLDGRQPAGGQLGNQGPDQGYVLTLARQFAGTLYLTEGEHEVDALAGAASVALKRASLFGRAPVIHDLRVGLTIWGFLGRTSPAALIKFRRSLFDECHHPGNFSKLRAIADAVPAEVLRQPTGRILEAASDWTRVISAPRP